MFGTVDIRVQLAGQEVTRVLSRLLQNVGSRVQVVDSGLFPRQEVMQSMARVGDDCSK